jgi:ankyrin repeat protein
MDFNFIKIARSFIKKESRDEKEKANQFVRKLEDKFKELFVTKRNSKILDVTHITLFSVYDCMDIMRFECDEVMSNSIIKSKINATPVLTSNFKRNFGLFCEWQLDDIDWKNIIVCGGSVLASLMSPYDVTREQYQMMYNSIEIELFIYGLGGDDANKKLLEIYASIKRRNPYDLLCVRTPDYISIVSQSPFRSIKIRLRLYKSPAEVLMGFDTDCCAIGYDGDKVYGTPRWHYAITTFTNRYNACISTESYIDELLRWFKLGFSVEIPGLDTSLIDPRIYTDDINGSYGYKKLLVALKTGSMNGQPALKQEIGRLMMIPIPEVAVSTTQKASYTASEIAELIYQRDIQLNVNRSDYPLHPCFIGSMNDVIHDCANEPFSIDSVPFDQQEAYISHNVYGKLQWKTGLLYYKQTAPLDVHIDEKSLEPHRLISDHNNDNIDTTTSVVDIFGRSLMELSVLFNNADALKLIIEKNPDNPSITKCICLASEMGDLNMIKMLTNIGSSITTDDSPLVSSIIMGHFEVFDYLYNHPKVKRVNGIFRICWLYRKPQFIEYLVKAGLDCNEVNNGEHLLDEVIRYDDVNMVSLFIKCGHILDTERSVYIAVSRYLGAIGDEKEIAKSIIMYLISISKDLTINQYWKPLDLLINEPDLWLIEYLCERFDLIVGFTFNRPNVLPKEFTLLDRIISMLSDDRHTEKQIELEKIKNVLITHKAKRINVISDVKNKSLSPDYEDRYRALVKAVKKGDVKTVTEMMIVDPSLAKPANMSKTPLYYACRNDDHAMFKTLLNLLNPDEFKHIINHRSIRCYRTLFDTYDSMSYAVKSMIIEANVEFVKRGMVEFLDIGFNHGLKYNVNENKFGLKRNDGSKRLTYIEMAAIAADPKSIVYMAKYAGESVDMINDNGETLLHQLAKSKTDSDSWVHSFHVITKLSKIEDLINVTDNEGYTPIHRYYMERRSSYSMIDVMMNADARLSMPNNEGEYPIHTLAKYGKSVSIHTVYRYDKAIIDSHTVGSMRTPLMMSIIHENTEVAILLIQLGCNTELVDIYGNNALHYACMYSNNTILNILPSRRLIENCFGMTYIDYAINRAKMVTPSIMTRRRCLLCLDAVKGRIKDSRIMIDRLKINDMYEFILRKI